LHTGDVVRVMQTTFNIAPNVSVNLACFEEEAKAARRQGAETDPNNPRNEPLKTYGIDGRLVKRFPVPDDKAQWSEPFEAYRPPYLTLACLLTKTSGKDDKPDGAPKNPAGRTGLEGRGALFYFGPNVATDYVITRYKRNAQDQLVLHNGKPVVEFLAIRRRADLKWALPGSFQPDFPAVLQKAMGCGATNDKDNNAEMIELVSFIDTHKKGDLSRA